MMTYSHAFIKTCKNKNDFQTLHFNKYIRKTEIIKDIKKERNAEESLKYTNYVS